MRRTLLADGAGQAAGVNAANGDAPARGKPRGELIARASWMGQLDPISPPCRRQKDLRSHHLRM